MGCALLSGATTVGAVTSTTPQSTSFGVAQVDGYRIIRADSEPGAWMTDTIPAKAQSYTVTGALHIVNGKVIIRNGGAELGVRGFVAAYDVGDGKQLWKFFTVPGDPRYPPENVAIAPNGMPSFMDVLTAPDVDAIHQYVIKRAHGLKMERSEEVSR